MSERAFVAVGAPARGGRWRGAVVLIAALAMIALCARLGVWQLDRAAQKNALQASLDARSTQPPLAPGALARTADGAAAQHFRRATVQGRWLGERTVFLDNRQMDGKVGFFVVTPLALQGSGAALLVQRGWVGRDFNDRAALPTLATPAGVVSVAGVVAPPPSRLFEFADSASGPIRQNLDIASFARESGLDLLPLSLLQHDLAGAVPDGLLRHWPAPASDVQKHYGYAVQWFAIAAAIAFLYVWHRFIRPRRR
jgi:surfeit locus 1 family protein